MKFPQLSFKFAAVERIQQRFNQWFDALPSRDRTMLTLLFWFLLVTVCVGAYYVPQAMAKKTEVSLSNERVFYDWLLSKQTQLKPTGAQRPLADEINALTSGVGLTAQTVQMSTTSMSFTTEHTDYSVLANVLSQLISNGYVIKSFNFTELPNKHIQLQAVVEES